MNPRANNVTDKGTHLEVDVSTSKFPFAVMLIDRSDFENFRAINIGKIVAMSPGRANRSTYAMVRVNGKYEYVHRFIIGNTGKHTDHLNGNGLDNRRNNLRVVDCSQNFFNRSTRIDNNTGIKGIRKNKSGTFVVDIAAYGKRYRRTYSTLDEAIAARKEAERIHHGAYAGNGTQNHIPPSTFHPPKRKERVKRRIVKRKRTTVLWGGIYYNRIRTNS